MGLTKEVDLKLLHRCFDLDAFDNLLKADFMDAVRARRDLIREQHKRREDNIKIQQEIQRRRETQRCHIIAQRMALQEHLIRGASAEDIIKQLDDMINNEEQYKLLDKEGACQHFNGLLDSFEITNPTSDFFLDPQNNDETLVCNIQSKLEFLLNTLEIFGLPQGYINGVGHHLDWEQKKAAAAGGRGKKKGKGGAAKKGGSKINKLQEALQSKKDELNKKPIYFDLEPIKKALKSFLQLNAESRSTLRI